MNTLNKLRHVTESDLEHVMAINPQWPQDEGDLVVLINRVIDMLNDTGESEIEG